MSLDGAFSNIRLVQVRGARIHRSQASAHDAHDLERKMRRLPHHEQEVPLVEPDHLACRVCPHRRAARATIDEGHLAYYAAWTNNLKYSIAVSNLQLARSHDIELVVRIALIEENFSRLEANCFAPAKAT